jgi:predicted HicB family RNase H-like nuclease
MEYKGYVAHIEYDDEIESFFGHVINTRDQMTFYGKNPKQLKKEFKTTVDVYIDFCKREGKEPEKPYSGTLYIRTEPQYHRLIAEASAKAHLSINQFAEAALIKAAQQSL